MKMALNLLHGIRVKLASHDKLSISSLSPTHIPVSSPAQPRTGRAPELLRLSVCTGTRTRNVTTSWAWPTRRRSWSR
jgi:hypothetical protein